MNRVASLIACVTWVLLACTPVTGRAGTIEAESQRIELSLVDLLDIYSRLATTEIAAKLDRSMFASAEVVFLNAQGKTVIDFVFNETKGRSLQREGAGEATKSLTALHVEFFRALRAPESALPFEEGRGNLARPPTPTSALMRDWIRGRTSKDFLTQVRFERDGTKFVYATVDEQGVRFNPDAPAP